MNESHLIRFVSFHIMDELTQYIRDDFPMNILHGYPEQR